MPNSPGSGGLRLRRRPGERRHRPLLRAHLGHLVRCLLVAAGGERQIRRNRCRIRGAGKEPSAERQVATVDQVDALANALGPRWRPMVFLGAYGPMRPEQQAELRREGVDLDAMTIRVRMAAPELMTGRRAPGDTRSDAGKRLVVLPAFLRTDLRRHLDWYAEKGPDELLFVGEKGKPFRRSTVGRKWRQQEVASGLDVLVRATRGTADQEPSGTDLVRDA